MISLYLWTGRSPLPEGSGEVEYLRAELGALGRRLLGLDREVDGGVGQEGGWAAGGTDVNICDINIIKIVFTD